MAYLTESDLTLLLRQENLNAIKRSDNTMMDKKIKAGIAEAKIYLKRFDVTKLFGDDITPPEIEDEALKQHVIAIVCYHCLKITTAGVNMGEYRLYYEEAIAYLKDIQKGAIPDGWPLRPDDEDTGEQPGKMATWSSNPKQNLHF